MINKIKLKGVYKFIWVGNDGKVKEWDSNNMIVNEGIQATLDAIFATTFYVGLTASTPTPAAGDTMSSHAGWTENTSYTEGVRQTYTDVRTGQTVSNTASKATFTFSAGTTIGGAFLVSNSTKGGTTGTLLSISAFTTGDEVFASGGTLQVTYELSASDA